MAAPETNTPFRLTDEERATLDALISKTGKKNRTEVIKYLIAKARAEFNVQRPARKPETQLV